MSTGSCVYCVTRLEQPRMGTPQSLAKKKRETNKQYHRHIPQNTRTENRHPAPPGRPAMTSDHRISGPSDHRTIGSADHRTIGPSDHRISGASDHRVSGPSDHRICGPSDNRIIGPSDQRNQTCIGSADHRTIGSSNHRISGSSDHRISGSAVGSEPRQISCRIIGPGSPTTISP